MRISEYHAARLRRDPEYAAAVAREAGAQAFADEVVAGRVALGWSQTELADHSDITQANISRIERGVGNPTLDTITKLRTAIKHGQEARYSTLVFSYNLDSAVAETVITPNETVVYFDVGHITYSPITVNYDAIITYAVVNDQAPPLNAAPSVMDDSIPQAMAA